jgi:ADP-ribosylation factor GTPase-activating protein 2/3
MNAGHEGPNVQVAFNTENSNMEEQQQNLIKSNILQKKAAPAKKKGLGAQKVNANFNEIERGIQEQERLREQEQQDIIRNKEESEKQAQKQMASMKLAYDNLDKQREKEEIKLKQQDPKKAQQLERLGMAAGNRSSGISHSALNDMQIIQQEGVFNTKQSMPSSKKDFFDDFESNFSSKLSMNSSSNRFNEENMDYRGFDTKPALKNNNNSKFDDWVQIDEKFDDYDSKTPSFSDNKFTSAKYVPPRPKNTHGFGLDFWIFMDFLGPGLGWASSSQPKPKTVGIFGCKCLVSPSDFKLYSESIN